jgi:hypothetical protein
MYQLRVLVNGRPIPIYRDYRTGLDWIEARNGTKYEIEVKNDSYNRILAVVSVDGLNVINGKHEDPLTATGYILHQHNNIKIPGWKISSDNVREFYFTPQDQSYSAKLGASLANTGVIAAAIYKEKVWYSYTCITSDSLKWPNSLPSPWTVPSSPWITYSTNSSNGILRSADIQPMSMSVNDSPQVVYNMSVENLSAEIPATPKLATGSGAVADFKTNKATFGERVLETIMTLYYDTKEGLIKKGIYAQQDGLPKPFPNTEFCPDV